MPSRSLRLTFALGLAALAVSCSDSSGPGGDNPAAMRLIAGDGQSGNVGQPLPLPLTVEVRGFDTLGLPGVRVDFRTVAGLATIAPASVKTDAQGRASVVVTPGIAGSIQVAASVFSSSLSVPFLLSAAGTASTACAPSNATALLPAEILPGLGGTGICLSGGSSGATFALVAFNAAATPATVATIALDGTSISPGPTQWLQESPNSAKGSALSWPVPEVAPAPATVPRTALSDTMGAVRVLNVNLSDDCTNPEYRTGRVVAVTATAVAIVDGANPAAGFSDAEIRSMAITFDTLLNPIDTLNFRGAADLDANGRIVLFFTSSVNRIAPTDVSHSTAVFRARDLHPQTSQPSMPTPCAAGNAGEMLYVAVPDAAGIVGVPRTKQQLANDMPRAIVHEYQHLINASRRLYVYFANLEEPWLDEGLSLIAEEVLFQRIAARRSRENLGAYDLSLTLQSLNAFGQYQRPNIDNYARYLANTPSFSPVFAVDTRESRGAVWSLLRYLVDRREDSDFIAWTALLSTTATGIENLRNVFGPTLSLQMRDWSIAVLVDDQFSAAPRFTQPSWNFRSIFAAIGVAPFPIKLEPISGAPITRSIAAGSAAYFTFTVAAGVQGGVRWGGAAGGPVPPMVQWSIVRLQ